MAAQAQKLRASCVVELDEAIRQASRYLKSTKPSVRLVQQKVKTVTEKEEKLKKSHFSYCDAADIEVDSDDAIKFIQDKIDEATDCVDQCLIYIEEQEIDSTKDERAIERDNAQREYAEKEKARFEALTAQISADERFVLLLFEKVKSTMVREEHTIENMVLVKSYVERLQNVLVNLNQSWNEVISQFHDVDGKRAQEITRSRVEFEEVIASASVFVEKCSNEEATRLQGNSSIIGGTQRSSTSSEQLNHDVMRHEKIKHPEFSGDIRAFARFRKDFEKIVRPYYGDEGNLVYVMKQNCLKGSAKDFVENAETLEEVWRRLEAKYGDKMDLVDLVIKDLDSVPVMKPTDDAIFVGMVDLLEKGLRELEGIGVRHDVANSYTVKVLESKLCRDHYLSWLKEADSLEGSTRFEKLFSFLIGERKRIEKLVQRKDAAVKDGSKEKKDKGKCNYSANEQRRPKKNNCLVHPNVAHFTRQCNAFKSKTAKERADIVKATKGCPLCLSTSHIGKPCGFIGKWEPCKVDNCGQFHSQLLHEAVNEGLLLHARGQDVVVQSNQVQPQGTSLSTPVVSSTAGTSLIRNTLLLIQPIASGDHTVIAFFDNGSTISLVSTSYVRRNNMRGIRVRYDLISVGGHSRTQKTYLHNIALDDAAGNKHVVQAFEIDDICGRFKEVDVSQVVGLFQDVKHEDVQRKSGAVELLIGMNHASIHPNKLQEAEGLVLYESLFGSKRVLGGSHTLIKDSDNLNAHVQITAHSQIENVRVMFADPEEDFFTKEESRVKHTPRCDQCRSCSCRVMFADPGVDFFTAEEFGVKLAPSCDRCRNCKNCTVERHQMSRQDQRELVVIENNMVLDPLEQRWTAKYPLKNDPVILQNNEQQVTGITLKWENKLLKDPVTKQHQVKEQYFDFIRRGILSEMSVEEREAYHGPEFFSTVHEVFKEGSSSMPLRLVINSSLKYKGLSLNDILMKGPNTLNDLYTVQLRFRCYTVPLVCDISKMYHQIKTTEVERHLRLVKWRNLDTSQEMKIYGMNTVTFGDRPAAAIATVALRKTAELYRDLNPVASEKIILDSYVDDITTGAEDEEKKCDLQKGIVEILAKGGFQLKGFVTAGDSSAEQMSLLGSGDLGRVLGIVWDPRIDVFKGKVRINLSRKYKSARTERDLKYEEIPSILEYKITKRILLSIINSCYDPLGLLAPVTIQMKIAFRELQKGIGWDEELPKDVMEKWIVILQRVKQAEEITFPRCVKPAGATSNPILIMCNDGSELGMCASGHIRWELEDGSVKCQLWSAKTRVTPLRKMTIPRIEMQSAVLATRLCKSIKKSSIWEFDKVYHIVDSECTLATLRKDTIALREFMGNRVSEVLDESDVGDWYHVRTKLNIADLGTRDNATIESISETSDWQNGLSWMHLPVDEWPVNQDLTKSHVPEEELVICKLSAAADIDEPIIQYEDYRGKSYTFVLNLTARVLKVAKQRSFLINELTVDDVEKAEPFILKTSMKFTRKLLQEGRLDSLRPEIDDDGIIRLGSRALEGLKNYYETDRFPILSNKDPIAFLWMKHIHWENHTGATSTTAKSRRKFWILQAPRMAAKIRKSCYRCRLLDKLLAEQQMAPLPTSRQVMSPTFHQISLDLFGHLLIKDNVKQRSRKKVWGVITTCLATRAVHIDVTEDYGADSIIQCLRRFTSLRGCPASIYSDKGSQLMAAADELRQWTVSNGIKWDSAPAEGQHMNGVTESLVKSVKRSLLHVIGENVLTYAGLQTVFYEVSNLINARPIGVVSGSDPTHPTPITPNHLLLGRSTPEVAKGNFDSGSDTNRRFRFIQTLVNDWWKVWYKSVLPSLVPSYKWLQRHRNVQPGDVCLIKYQNELKGSYRLGRVKSVKKSKDGLVRTVQLQYKLPNEKAYREVDRPIHGIAVIVPIEEQSFNSSLDAKAQEFTPSENS